MIFMKVKLLAYNFTLSKKTNHDEKSELKKIFEKNKKMRKILKNS